MNTLRRAIWKSSKTLAALLTSVSFQALAEESSATFPKNWFEPIGLSGSLRLGEYYRDRSFSTDKGYLNASLWGSLRPDAIFGIKPVVDFRAQAQNLTRTSDVDLDLREAFLETSLGSFDIRVGRQIIVWGRADKVNPTDNLTVRDFELLVTDDEDQRSGPFSTQITWNIGDYRWIGIWQPEWRQPVFPLGAIGSGISIRYGQPLNTYEQFALKLDRSGGDVDWSVSYFHGIDRTPDIALVSATPTSTELELLFQKIDVIGADFATTLGQWGLRGEVAYTRTADTSGLDPFTKNANLFAVLGVERSFFENFNINAQYLYRHVFNYYGTDFGNPGLNQLALQVNINAQQLAPNMHGTSLRLSHKAFNETLESELAFVTWFTTSDYLIRPKLTYAFSDSFRGTLGVEIFAGQSSTYFGRLKNVSNGFGELRLLF